MAETISYRFRCRRRTAESWATLNEVLLPQEIGLESDTGLGKVGDNAGTPWNDLLYTIVGQVDLTGLADGKCLAWDAGNSRWYVADRGVAYTAGTGINIDTTNPAAPVISSTLGSIAIDGSVDTYAELPSPPPSGDLVFLNLADGLIYIWDGTGYPAEGDGLQTGGGLEDYDGPDDTVFGGALLLPTRPSKYFKLFAEGQWYVVPGYIAKTFGTWTPEDITVAPIEAWYISDRGIQDSGGAVDQWSDSSSKARHAIASPGARPTLISMGLNSRQVLAFNGSSNVLSVTNRTGVLQNTSGAWLAIVYKNADINTTPKDARLFHVNTGTAGKTRLGYFQTNSTGYVSSAQGRRLDSDDNKILASNITSVIGDWRIDVFYVNYATGEATLAVNGTIDKTSAAMFAPGSTSNTVPTEMSIGGYSVGQYAPAQIAEIVLGQGGALTTADRQKLEGYLAERWGLQALLPVSHPYKSVGPSV